MQVEYQGMQAKGANLSKEHQAKTKASKRPVAPRNRGAEAGGADITDPREKESNYRVRSRRIG
jgi:hypothetical protein